MTRETILPPSAGSTRMTISSRRSSTTSAIPSIVVVCEPVSDSLPFLLDTGRWTPMLSDMIHEVEIAAKPQTIYRVITTQEGEAGFWVPIYTLSLHDGHLDV